MASLPVMVMPATETVLPVPTVLSANVAAVFEIVTASPATMFEEAPATVAVVPPSYVLLLAVNAAVRLLVVMLAVVVA